MKTEFKPLKTDIFKAFYVADFKKRGFHVSAWTCKTKYPRNNDVSIKIIVALCNKMNLKQH